MMKKRITALVLAVSMLLIMLPITANADKAQETKTAEELMKEGVAKDIAIIKARGTLNVALPSGDQPAFFESDENGNLSGIDIDLARNIADAIGVKANFIRIHGDYSDLTKALQFGKADLVIATYSRNFNRLQYVEFSEPYLSLNFGVMVNNSAMVKAGVKTNPIPYMKKNPVDIAIASGTSHVDVAKTLFPEANIIETDSYDEATDMVVQGKAFATLSGELEFYTKYLENPQLGLYVTTYTFNDVKDEFAVGVNRNYPHLLEMVNLYIETNQPITVEDVKERYDEEYRKNHN